MARKLKNLMKIISPYIQNLDKTQRVLTLKNSHHRTKWLKTQDKKKNKILI